MKLPPAPAPPPPIKLKLKLGGGGGGSGSGNGGPSSVRPLRTSPAHHDWNEDDLLHSIDRDRDDERPHHGLASINGDSNHNNDNPAATPNHPSTTSKRRKPQPKLSVDSMTTTTLSTPSGLKLKLNLGGSRPGSDPSSTDVQQGRGRRRSSPSFPPSRDQVMDSGGKGIETGMEVIPTLPSGSTSSTPKIKLNIKKPQASPLIPSTPPTSTTTSTSTSTSTPKPKPTKKPKPTVPGAQVQIDDPVHIGVMGMGLITTPRIKVKLSTRPLVDQGQGQGQGQGQSQTPSKEMTEEPRDHLKDSNGDPGEPKGLTDPLDPSTPSKPPLKRGNKTKVLKFKTPSAVPPSSTSSPPDHPSLSSVTAEPDHPDQPEPSTSTPNPSSTLTPTPTPTPSKPRKPKKGNSPGSPGAQSSTGLVKTGKGRPKSKLREELTVGLSVSGSGLEGEGEEGEVPRKVEESEGDVKREDLGVRSTPGEGMGGEDGAGALESKQDSHPVDETMDIKPDVRATEHATEEGGDEDGRDGDEMDYGEDELDLLSTPMDIDSPGGAESTSSSPHPGRNPRVGGKGSSRHKKPFAFRKKPLPLLLHTIIGNLRRKDAYGLFFDPVSLEEYPNYFEVIGGEGEAMDLGTMEGKVDRGEYRDMAEFESDVDKMISAAQKFNPDDTLVHREAAKVAQLAARQFARFRGLVKTPSPSPERETPTSGLQTPGFELAGSVGPTPSNRSVSPTGTTYKESGGSLERPAVVALQPRQMVPEGMLDYPPNSDIARCVGWYLTGGKRPRTKKEQRAKEKWDGTWREWNATGDRDLREADNIMDLLRDGFTFETSGDKIALPRTVDWQDEAMNASEVWQPTPTLTGIVSDEVVPSIPYRPIDHLDVGRYQNLAGSYGFPEHKGYDGRKFLHDLEVDLDSVWMDEERDNQTERPIKVVKDMCLGEDMAAEAYVRSIDAFIAGARGWVDKEASGRKRKHEEIGDIKPEPVPKRHAAFAHFDSSRFDLGMPLSDYVGQKWRGGWLQAGMRGTVRQTQAAYRQLLQDKSKADDDAATTKEVDELITDEDIASYTRNLYIDAVRDASKRIPIALEIEAYGARLNGLDLACLLHIPSDFAAGGSAMGPPPHSGPGRAAWYEKSLQLAGQQIVDAAKRRETMAEEEIKGEAELAKLTRLRLDLLSLAKNVPVYELRPMTPEEVELLPPAVRGLIKVVPKV